MKIALVFIGAIRECKDLIKENIESLRESFDESHDISIFLSTWNPNVEEYTFEGRPYTYEYNKNDLINQLDKTVDQYIFLDQRPLDEYLSLINGCKPIFIYQITEISKFFQNSKLKFDYIFVSRHDIKIKIKNINNYLNSCFNICPVHFNNGVPSRNPINLNDHFFITSFKTFMKFTKMNDEVLMDLSKNIGDNEAFNYAILTNLGKINYLNYDDVVLYIVRNNRFYVT